jgi:hypothetical protein
MQESVLKYNKILNDLFMFINHFPENSPVGTKYCCYKIRINIGNALEIHLQ